MIIDVIACIHSGSHECAWHAAGLVPDNQPQTVVIHMLKDFMLKIDYRNFFEKEDNRLINITPLYKTLL